MGQGHCLLQGNIGIDNLVLQKTSPLFFLAAADKLGALARQLPLHFPTVSQVQMAVEAKFVQDTLKGDGVTEIRMRFIRRIEDNLPAGEE